MMPPRPLRGPAALVVLSLLLASCGGGEGGPEPAPDAVADDPPSVVVTMNVLADVVDTAFADVVEVGSVMPPGVDPHSFELSASAAQDLVDADLIVVNGLGLEENVLPVVEAAAADGVAVLEIAPLVDPIAYADGWEEGGTTTLDPHVWTDVSRMAGVPALVADALSDAVELDPETAALLRQRAEDARAALESLDAEVEALLSTVPDGRRSLVTNHHVFGYFAERYDFTVLGAVIPGGTTLASPSAADLEDLVAVIEESQVRTLFADASSPTLLVDALATEADLQIEVVALWTESLSPPGEGAETYAQMMLDNATRIADGLRG